MGFKKFAQLVWIEQTLFSLPFAYLGVLFAGGGTIVQWIWVTVAMAGARTAAMSFNRVIDAEIDRKNPRTSGRLVPRGEVKRRSVWLIAGVSSLVLVVAAYMLNPLCFYLSAVAVVLLFTYSYFKRFTSFSHFYLGVVEAAAPIGGYLAIKGEFTLVPFLLGFIILMWMAGLDIVYSLQDLEIDKRDRLHSMPVTIGKGPALVVSAGCYVLSVVGMVLAGMRAGMPVPYWFGVAGVGAIYTYQQILARSEDIASTIGKFLGANAYVSITLFAGTAVAVVLR